MQSMAATPSSLHGNLHGAAVASEYARNLCVCSLSANHLRKVSTGGGSWVGRRDGDFDIFKIERKRTRGRKRPLQLNGGAEKKETRAATNEQRGPATCTVESCSMEKDRLHRKITQ